MTWTQLCHQGSNVSFFGGGCFFVFSRLDELKICKETKLAKCYIFSAFLSFSATHQNSMPASVFSCSFDVISGGR